MATINGIDFTDGRIFQRNASTGETDVPLSGTYTGAVDSVECRIVKTGTSTEVVGWTVVDAAPTGGTWSGTITVPQGSPSNGTWYNFQSRVSNEPATTAEGVTDFGVGIIILGFGASTQQLWNTSGHGTDLTVRDNCASVNGRDSGITPWHDDWVRTPTFNGIVGFLNRLSGAIKSMPVGFVEHAIGGTGVGASAGSIWNDFSSGSIYDHMKTNVLDSCQGNLEFIHMACGTGDAIAQSTESEFETDLAGLISQLRSDFTNKSTFDNLPFLMTIQWRRNTVEGTLGYDVDYQAVRKGGQDTIDGLVSDVYYAAEIFDLPIYDTIHLADEALVRHGERVASSVAYLLDFLPQQKGPTIVGYEVISTTVLHVHLRHNGGIKVFPDSNIFGFRVEDDGTPVTIDSVTASVNKAVITLNSAYSGVLSVHYLWGKVSSDGAEDDLIVADIMKDEFNLPCQSLQDIPVLS